MAQKLSILNDPPQLLEGPRLLHHLIRWEKNSSSCALDFTSLQNHQLYSYQELRACVDALSVRIRDALPASSTHEGRAQHIIPLLLPQSPALYITQLAILESGGAFAPINLDAPKERIQFVVGDVAAGLIVTTSEFKESVSWENGPIVIIVDEFPTSPKQISAGGPSREVTESDLAYVLYTSGSSGLPKGVGVSHLAVTQSLLAHQRHIPVFKRFLQFAAPSFDVSVFEIFFPFLRGSTLVGVDRQQLLNDLPGMITQLEIDAAELTPTVAGSLLQKRSNAPCLKLLLTIGEMLTRPIVEEFGGSETQENMLYGMYGPTEAAIHCTIYPKMEASAKPGNIGVPFDTVSTFIVSASSSADDAAQLNFLPVGELGELVLGGPQLARGYINRPDQNKAAFVTFEGRNYYRTGDKARQLENGTVEILGRMSAGQVKLRGQRVELGEIEEAVYKHPGIKTVSAVVIGSVLVVFALIGTEIVEAEDVLKTCAQWLPSFMIPSEIVLLDKFSYLPSGKVDKRKLEADYQNQRNSGETHDPVEETSIESKVRAIVQDTLGTFPKTARLAAVGLDSLVAIKVASKLRSAGFDITTLTVLQAETLSALTQICSNATNSVPEAVRPSMPKVLNGSIALNGHAKDLEYTMPCTPLQIAMLSETVIDRRAYWNWVEIELPGITDIEDVCEMLYTLCHENSILRTGFAESQDSNGYIQVVWKNLDGSQIEEVEAFDYKINDITDFSFHHPLRVQLLQSTSSTRVLIHIHHALYDAWSLELLLDDIETLLDNKPLISRPTFDRLVSGYQDKTLISNSWATKDYWKDHLLNMDFRPLPNFHPKKAARSGLANVYHNTCLPTSDIESAAKRMSSSPQSIFQAAYAMVLSAYLGTPDVCFGTVFSGRTLPIAGIEDIVGPCLATLPIRVEVSSSLSSLNLVQEINAINRKHLEHSALPLREIKYVAGVNPRSTLFDTLLIWQQTLHSYDHTRNHVRLIDSVDNLEFNLTLEIIPGTGNIKLKANYNQSIFPLFQVTTLLEQVENLTKFIVENDSMALKDSFKSLDMELLSITNSNPDTELKSGTLSSPVERMAYEDPDRPAIAFAQFISETKSEIQTTSYGELNTLSNKIAHYVHAQDASHEVICVCMEKGVELYASILAVVKLNAGYLPVTPDIPTDRLQHILEEANVTVILARSESRSSLKRFHHLTVIYIDEVDLSRLPSSNLPREFVPDSLAYCVYTSGSTGKPKGVMVTHGNLVSNLDVLEELYPTKKDSRFLQSCSQSFDVSVFEIFFAWRVGGCLCSANKDTLFRDIEQAIRSLEVTHLSMTPTVAALVDPANVPRVKFLVTAGEAVTQKVFNTWAGKGLYQGYGPSETTNICTVNAAVSQSDSINNIGTPFRNTSAFVLSPDDDFLPVPRGGEGEFCFGGSQVFRGYMDSSREVGKIIDHPDYGRLYRSGDFGRLMPDGSLAFTGRKDDQVKIRGQRLELGEITHVMLSSHEVRDCITMIIGNSTLESERLVCFWTSEESSAEVMCLEPDQPTIERLYNILDSTLPVYMIPSSLIPISFLPSTPQGKIDKRLLAGLYQELSVQYLDSTSRSTKSASDHQWTDLETKIAKNLADISNQRLEDITPDTSFFSLGIDSISAISLARSLRHETGLRIEISDVLKYHSVIRLAEKLLQSAVDLGETDLATEFDFGIDAELEEEIFRSFKNAGREVRRILPCTPLQEAMLSAAESSSSSQLYQNHVVMDISGDVDTLKACWREMIQRHEILRTCFFQTSLLRFAYVQAVMENFELSFGEFKCDSDLTDQIIAEKNKRGTPQNEYEPRYSLDFVHSNGKTKLLISMHHAIYDGAAVAILYEEVERFYRKETLPKPMPFSPFLQAMVSMDFEKSDQFWNEKLHGYRPSSLQAMRIGKSELDMQHGSRVQRIYADFPLSYLEESAKKYSTSLLSICHAAWASVLSTELQKTDVCFGNVVSGRTTALEGIERLVAPCFNSIPSRISNMHKLSYLEAFRVFQAFHADCLPFQLTPLRRIQSQFSDDGARLYDTLFILQQPVRELDPSIWSIEADSGAMDLPFVCEVVPDPAKDTLEIMMHTHCSATSSEDAQRLLDLFHSNLQTAMNTPRHQILAPGLKDTILRHEICFSENTAASKPEETSFQMTNDESMLRDLISNFTAVPKSKISRDMSIFRLGLDSISTVQVATMLRKQGHQVSAVDILQNPTIKQLSAILGRNHSAAPEGSGMYDFTKFDDQYRRVVISKCRLLPDQIQAIRPCTAVQQGMIAQSLHSDGKDYMNSISFELNQEQSLSSLKQAWAKVCNKHEMLRTGFAATEDSANPFVMITYQKDGYQLPWFEDASQVVKFDFTAQLLERPWSLRAHNEDGRRLLVLKVHHALYDAQSIALILEDVANACNPDFKSETISIEPLLNAILVSAQENEAHKKEFWQSDPNKIIINRFPDLTPLRVLDTSSFVREIVSSSSVQELESYCREADVTMQAAGQAAWARILAAYTGESSTTFGMTLSGRSIHDDADKITFPTIVTLPVRCDVTGTNQELLSRTMESNALLHAHQFTPLTKIQKWAGFPEGKIFDTLFAYQKLPESPTANNQPWRIVQEEAVVDYAVSLEVQPTSSGKLTLRLTFQNSLIPEEQAETLLKQYDAILRDTLLNPNHNAIDAPMIGKDLLSITPAIEPKIPGSITLLHQFVESGAEQWPDKIALEFATCVEPGNLQSKTWTYQELNEEANKVAHLLLKQSVLPGELIAICFDKCAEASIAIVGILKAGCAYVALDPNAPADRSKFIIADSGAKLILSAGKPGKELEKSMNQRIILLDSNHLLDNYSSKSPTLARPVSEEDTSYCLYTSGTTGTPKGCILTHSNAVQAMYAFQRLFTPHWTPASKWLQFASFHFDVSVLEQFWSWSVGICVVSAPRDLIFEDIPSAIRELGVTHIDLTPSLARLLRPEDVPGLTKGVFITGGEQLKQEILDVWGEHACIYNGYGPTEATIGVTMYPRVPKNGKPSNIGPQFDNVGSFVLKPNTSLPVLRGAVGELCVSGMLVGKGYLNRPDLTTERFPTLEGYNERVYRTGDLVRILHDGTFIFLGRADDQVKLRGQRLELGEINEVIKKSKRDLEEVVTLVLKHTTQQKEQLVSFLVTPSYDRPSENGDLIATVRDACKSRLPGYMVPTHFIPIKAMPLNANNKADSKQLAVLYNGLSLEKLQSLSRSSEQHKPWTSNELAIIEVLAAALNVEASAITRSSNIFELGMDSISIIGFSRALQSAGYANAKLSLITKNTSISSLVESLLGHLNVDTGRETAHIAASQNIALFSQRHLAEASAQLNVESSSIHRIAPCTPVQEGMIYRFLESEDALYFNKFEFRLNDQVNLQNLSKAWNNVTAQLEILRTSFVATDDGFAQIVRQSSTVASYEEDIISYNKMDKMEALRNPWALKITSGIMILHAFHALYDGNSLVMILQKVVEEYLQLGNAQDVQPISYGPSFHDSLPFGPLAKIPGAESFWAETLQGWYPQHMPRISDSTTTIELDDNFLNFERFEAMRKQLGVSHQAILQAAWISTLQSMNSPNLTTTGIVISGRTIDFLGADDVIGPLFNTIPFHKQIPSGTTWKSLITDCHKFNMQMQEFQHTPLKDIQRWGPAGVGQPLFEALFVFQRPDFSEVNYAKDLWTEVPVLATADYPLAFEATLHTDKDGKGDLALKIVAQASHVSNVQAERLLSQIKASLSSMLSSEGQDTAFRAEINGELSTSSSSQASNTSSQQNGDRLETWTTEAKIVRSEIALLANIAEEEVGLQSSIFELGLDSIDVIKLSSRLRKRGLELSVSKIIKCQRIDKMATMFEQVTKEEHVETNIVETKSKVLVDWLKESSTIPHDCPQSSILPATPLQQGMYHLMIQSDYQMYFNVDAFKLSDTTDSQTLIDAVRTAVQASPILSTQIVAIEEPRISDSYAQIIRVDKFPILPVEFESFEKTMSDELLKKLRLSAVARAKDTQELFQVRYLNIGSERYMIIAIAHALYDGASIQTFHQDIRRAYARKPIVRADPRACLEDVFKSTTDDAKTFWRNALSDLPAAQLVRKADSDPIEVFRSTRTSKISFSSVQECCKRSSISIQTLGQTCWALVLGQLMGQLDVVFGTVLSCRDFPDADKIMFPLMNTVAVRSVLHGTLDEMLKYMQDMSNTIRQYQHFPLGEAQAIALSSRKGTKGNTFFDTLFIYQGRRPTENMEQLYQSEYSHADVDFPICVELEIDEQENLTWTTACKSSVRTEDETSQVLDALDKVLTCIVESVNMPTFSADANGISICGLPTFRKTDSPSQISSQPPPTIDSAWSKEESLIREALHEVSGIPQESIHKDTTIFELGLDSISVHKVHKSLKTRGIKLSVSEILTALTISSMIESLKVDEVVEAKIDVEGVISDAISGLDTATDGYILPVTSGQEYMIRAWQASRGELFYPTFSFQLPSGTFDKAALESAWRILIQNHDILRTSFLEANGKLYQTVSQKSDNPVHYGESPVQKNPFEMSPVTLSLDGARTTLGLTIHHALYDAFSIELILNQLYQLYQGHAVDFQLSSFQSFVAEGISSASSEKWRSYLGDAKSTLIPSKAKANAENKRTELFKPSLPAPGLKAFARANGVTVDALLLSLVAKILSRITASTSPIFGIYLANRSESYQDMPAPTLNLIPLAVRDTDRDIKDVSGDVQSHLRVLAKSDMASVSLRQIYESTGVAVNCFVNILKDAGGSGDNRDDGGFVHVTSRPEAPAAVESVEWGSESQSRDSVVYQESLDIELRYREAGTGTETSTVDIGIFGPERLVSLQDAEEIVRGFKLLLSEF